MRRVPVDGPGNDPDQDNSPPEPQLCNCPFLDSEDWHEVESDWSDITFIQVNVPAVKVVFGLDGVKSRLAEEAAAAGAVLPEDAMMLIGEGKLRRPTMLEVELDDEPASAKIVTPGGVAFTRLVSAPPGRIKGPYKETVEAAIERYGRKPDTMWIWYLTCGVCSGDRDFETLFVAHYKQAPVAMGDAD